MKLFPVLVLASAVVVAGCTTRSKASAQARAAFVAGQRAGIAQADDARRTSIRVVGPVRQPEIAWTEGLTLARVVAAAGYSEARDPRSIVVIRQREQIPFDPQALLRGEDLPLEPGDTVEIRP